MGDVHKIGLITLLLTISAISILSGCLGEKPQPSSTPEEENLVSVAALANAISTDVGKVSISVNGVPEKMVIVFDEVHDSRAGQIEEAIMLNRLYNNGTKFIALEGALTTDDLETSWFQRLPDTKTKKEVAVQLLKKGEINSAEFIALIYPDVKVVGVEIKEEYDVNPPENGTISIPIYLMMIAWESLTSEEKNKANELVENNKTLEAMDFIINANKWTKEKNAWFEEYGDKIYSIEEMIKFLEEIDEKANKVRAKIDSKYKTYFQELEKFYRTGSKRSETIVANTLTISEKSTDMPIALIIGTGHTAKVAQLLNDYHSAYAVITGNSLIEHNNKSDLNWSTYKRKEQRLSVDEPNTLGSFLDKRYEKSRIKKLPPVLNEEWLRTEAEIYYIAERLARAAANNVPIPSGVKDELSILKYAEVDINSIQKVGDEVIFSVNVKIDGAKRTIWGRTTQSEVQPDGGEKTLEQLLKEALEDVNKEGDKLKLREELVLSEITHGVDAMFSPDEKAIKSTKIKV